MDADDLRTILATAAIVVSLVSLLFTRLNWLHSNRPIVSAFIEEDSTGTTGATCNLIVANTGNRPAVRVRLIASEQDISRIMDQGAKKERQEIIAETFSEESEIPLLRNGEELSTSFGAFDVKREEGKWLKYGAETEIFINYFDLEGRKYKSKLPLKVYAREGFGGSVWVKQKS